MSGRRMERNKKVYCCKKCFSKFVKCLNNYSAHFSQENCECTKAFNYQTGRNVMIIRIKCELCGKKTCCSSEMWEITILKPTILL